MMDRIRFEYLIGTAQVGDKLIDSRQWMYWMKFVEYGAARKKEMIKTTEKIYVVLMVDPLKEKE